MPAADNIRRVAVLYEPEEGVQMPTQFFILDQGRPLAAVIKELCDKWSQKNPQDYCLVLSDPKRQYFITERNRGEIQNGNILKLTFSPSKTAQDIYDKLSHGSAEDRQVGLKRLSELSLDNTFAQEFINKNGLHQLIAMIESGTYSGDLLGYILKTFVELMDHGIVSWNILQPKFIKMVANSVNITRNTVPDASTLQSALEILESIVLHSTGKYATVEQEVTPGNLLQHLQCSNTDIQKSAIALINALFLRADQQKRQKIADNLQSKSIRNVILNNVIRQSPSIVAPDMAHQLYMLQSLLFSLLESRKTRHVDVNDPVVLREITELRKIAFDTDPDVQTAVTRKQSCAKDYKKLGFMNQSNPAEDFTQVPPGILALDNMVYFAKAQSENFTKVVLENSCRADDHDLPFARASIELTIMLCEILKVGESPSDDGRTYYPMFFTHDRPFEEFFCICMILLNKTWKEMRATSPDFTKVMGVVREQITRALEIQPSNFDAFRTRLGHLSYTEITNIWQQERLHKDEWESQVRPIVELREQIKPEITDLIKRQRLNYLVEGTLFYEKISRRDRTCMYCRLSPNHKVLYYGDVAENTSPSIEQLPNKMAVVDIKSLVTGKDCPRRKKTENQSLAFGIMTETDMGESLNFLAPDEIIFHMWTDGINALLGNAMSSKQTEKDMEMLLDMEVRLRLLDTEGIQIPAEPPPIPSPPPNYDFHYKN